MNRLNQLTRITKVFNQINQSTQYICWPFLGKPLISLTFLGFFESFELIQSYQALSQSNQSPNENELTQSPIDSLGKGTESIRSILFENDSIQTNQLSWVDWSTSLTNQLNWVDWSTSLILSKILNELYSKQPLGALLSPPDIANTRFKCKYTFQSWQSTRTHQKDRSWKCADCLVATYGVIC